MGSIGDVFVSLRLDTAGFERGVSAAAQGTARLGQILDQFGRPMQSVSTSIADVGEQTRTTSEHFTLGARSMDRFAAIGIQQLVPSLQGSRIALEGVFQGVYRLTGGYASLVLGGVAVAGMLGGAIVAAGGFTNNIRAAAEGVNSLDEFIAKLEKDITGNVASIERWGRAARIAKEIASAQDARGQQPGREGFGLSWLLPGTDKTSAKIAADRAAITRAEGDKLLEDKAAGAIRLKIANDEANAFFALETVVKDFARTSALAATDDPLQKMLIADARATQALIEKITALSGISEKERADLLSTTSFFGDRNQQNTRDQFSKSQGPSIAKGLGLGDSDLITGFGDIEKFSKNIAGFSSEMDRLARAGIPVRDLFPEIAAGQQKVDDQIQVFKDKFADSPALLARVTELDKKFGQGGLRKSLDDLVRTLANVTQGSAIVEDEMGNRLNVVVGTLSNESATAGQFANYLAGVLFEDLPKAANAALVPVKILGDAIKVLRENMAAARSEALFFSSGINVGVGQTAVPANAAASGSSE